ncbi:hypothetical protein F5878DRAFT_647818 [Lentinula raphanica]|uniref:Uncharacterized protein n=1 Tax=Lentinula raphanica TaxID=153919 RepID=A0AA38NV69_9AGAR|nr:hypothetical protein F5878DRAFT_647818 [Lentinula raphanica]
MIKPILLRQEESEYITRRFLASCSEDEISYQTIVDVVWGDEKLCATGRVDRLQTLSEADVNHWCDRSLYVFSNLSSVARVSLPLPNNDYRPPFSILALYHSNLRWFHEIPPHGLPVLTPWGRETKVVAVLVEVLGTDFRLLKTSPDRCKLRDELQIPHLENPRVNLSDSAGRK